MLQWRATDAARVRAALMHAADYEISGALDIHACFHVLPRAQLIVHAIRGEQNV